MFFILKAFCSTLNLRIWEFDFWCHEQGRHLSYLLTTLISMMSLFDPNLYCPKNLYDWFVKLALIDLLDTYLAFFGPTSLKYFWYIYFDPSEQISPKSLVFSWDRTFYAGPPRRIWARQGAIFYSKFFWPVVSYKSVLKPKKI